MNSSNTDPLPEQGAIVAPFISPITLYGKHAAAPPVPFALAGTTSQAPDSIPDPPSATQETDPDWSVSRSPKRPAFRERLPADLTILAAAIHFGLDQSSFNGSRYRCPFHPDNLHFNLSFKDPKSRDGRFYCFACTKKGDLIDWATYKLGVSPLEAYLAIRSAFNLGSDDLLRDSLARQLPGKVRLPTARPFNSSELALLASQRRGWLPEGLRFLQNLNTLAFVPRYRDYPAYALRDPFNRIAALRRFDGLPWPDGAKARNAPGAIPGVPVGIHLAPKASQITLNEGTSDYLSIGSRLYSLGLSDQILPLMMLSANITIHHALLGVFESKRVRIIAQNDSAGLKAAKTWKGQLQSVGARVDVWIPPEIQIPSGGLTKDIDEILSLLDPTSISSIAGLKDIFNFNVTLLPREIPL